LLIARLVALGCLLGWAALLGTPALEPASRTLGGTSLLDLRSLTGAAFVGAGMLMRAALLALRFAPLGFFAVLVLPDQGGPAAEEIERRLAACAAYRETAPPAEAPPPVGPVLK
jgi:hypothetical protein